MKRRKFIRLGALSTFTLAPSLEVVSKITGINLLAPADPSQAFELYYRRVSDQLKLKFFLINLFPENASANNVAGLYAEIKTKGISSKNLVKIDAAKDAYLVIELPSQHISEGMLDLIATVAPDKIKDYTDDTKKTVRSFLSGTSFLVFKVSFSSDKKLGFNISELLKWNNHRLAVNPEVTGSEPAVLPHRQGIYPLSSPFALAPHFKDGKITTTFELPYKMFLSLVTRNANDKVLHQWDQGQNKEMKAGSNAFLLWHNRLKAITPQGEEPLTFRALAYADEEALHESTSARLLPNEQARPKLSKLLWLNNLRKRYLSASPLIVTGIGATTKLAYEDVDPVEGAHGNLGYVEWKQEINLGRDQFIKLVTLGLLVPSMTKALYIEIGERKIENGISFIETYIIIQRLQEEIVITPDFKPAPGYTGNSAIFQRNVPFSRIKVLTKQSPPFSKTDVEELKANGVAVAKIPKVDVGGLPRDIEFNFLGIDKNGKEVPFKANIGFIDDDHYKAIQKFDAGGIKAMEAVLLQPVDKDPETYLQNVESKRSFISLGDVELSYADASAALPAEKQKMTELKTKAIQLSFAISEEDLLKSQFPAVPQLKVAIAEVPSINSITGKTVPMVFNYANSFLEGGFEPAVNATKVFLNHIEHNSAIANAIEYKPKINNDIFKKNVKEFGALINPDIPIRALSIADQSIGVYEELNTKYKDKLQAINPRDILSGADATIIGGIKLSDILAATLPLDKLPVLNMIENIQDKINQLKAAELKILDEKRKLLDQLQTDVTRYVTNGMSAVLTSYLNAYADYRFRLLEIKKTIDQHRAQLSAQVASFGQDIYSSIQRYQAHFVERLSRIIGTTQAEILGEPNFAIQTIGNKTIDEYEQAILQAVTAIGDQALRESMQKIFESRELYNGLLTLHELKTRVVNTLSDQNTAAQTAITAYTKSVIEGGQGVLALKDRVEKQLESRYGTITAEVQAQLDASQTILANQLSGVTNILNAAQRKLEGDIAKVKSEITNLAETLKKGAVEFLKKQYADLQELKDKAKQAAGLTDEIKQQIAEVERKIAWLKVPNSTEVNYDWHLQSHFSDLNVGIIKFTRQRNTELYVNVKVRTEIDSGSLLPGKSFQPPRITSVSTATESYLRNFTIKFLELLSIDFAEVRFVAGSNRKSDFGVTIRDIQFGSSLSFLKVLQDFLSTLGLPFVVRVEPDSIGISYAFNVPNIEGGSFTFKNATIFTGFKLPFQNATPATFTFGVSSYDNRFLVAAGPFGGGGFLAMEFDSDSKNGLIDFQCAVEFGGYLGINLGVARGYVYLFAGIYYRTRQTPQGKFDEFAGYLVCGGVLNVLSIIQVFMSFYMGLESRGSYVQGRCTVTYGFRIGFIKKNVSVTLYRRLSGTQSQKQGSGINAQEALPEATASLFYIDSPLPEKIVAMKLSEFTEDDGDSGFQPLESEEVPARIFRNYINTFKI